MTFEKFKTRANDPKQFTEESSRDFILMLAENPATTGAALTLAEAQVESRHDLWTLDAYAWALYVNAKLPEADAAVQKAMATGIQSAQIFDHAGHIAQKLNRGEDAAKYFKLAIQANPTSGFAADALKSANLALARTDPPPNTQNASAPDPFVPGAPRPAQSATEPSPAPAVVHNQDSGISAAFAPVPQRLLTLLPTETSRSIQKAQLRLSRNPKDAEGYALLGQSISNAPGKLAT